MKKLLLMILICIPFLTYAQERVNREYATPSKPFAKFSKVKGWNYREYSGQWFDSNNYIFSVDKFKEMSFSLITYNAEQLLYLKKTRIDAVYKYKRIKEGRSNVEMRMNYVFRLSDYQEALNNMPAAGGEVVLDLIDFDDSDGNTLEYKYPYHKLSEDYHYTFHLKCRLFPEKKSARFFMYVLKASKKYPDIITLEGLDPARDTPLNNKEKDAIMDVINNKDVFEHFYYECSLDDFNKFFRAPLKQ